MPAVQLSEATFRRLQSRGRPFIDTPDTVVSRLLDQTENHASAVAGARLPGAVRGLKKLSASSPGDLRHTKVLSAAIGGRSATKWNELLVAAHGEALARLGNFDSVRGASLSSLHDGSRGDSGFRFQPELGFSIQYVDANHAWEQILHLAKQLRTMVEVNFMWREKEGAAFPGKRGVIRWAPRDGASEVSGANQIPSTDSPSLRADASGKKNVAFHRSMILQIERSLGVSLVKRTKAVWSSVDEGVGISCRASKTENKGGFRTFWFGLSPDAVKFLEGKSSAYFAFGLGKPNRILLFPFKFIAEKLDTFGKSYLPDGRTKHWHLNFRMRNGAIELQTGSTSEWQQVSEFLIEGNS